MKCHALIVPDTHAPFLDRRRFREVLAFARAARPRVVIHLGDLVDAWILSRFPKRELGLLTPRTVQKELEQASWILTQLRTVARTRILLRGNHEDRVAARMTEVPFMQAYFGDPFAELARAHGFEYRQSFRLGRIRVIHGYSAAGMGGDAAYRTAVKAGAPVVQAHSHGLGLKFHNPRIFGMECGHLVDTKSPAFRYDQGLPIGASKWTPGFGWIDVKGRPHLESLA